MASSKPTRWVAGPCGFRYRRLSVCPIQSGAKSNRSVRSRLSRSPVACCCLRARLKAKNKSTRTPESRGKEARVGISLIRNIFQCIGKTRSHFERSIMNVCVFVQILGSSSPGRTFNRRRCKRTVALWSQKGPIGGFRRVTKREETTHVGKVVNR
jgi:hypothetical protein